MLWIKASAHWSYKQCCVLNVSFPNTARLATSVSIDFFFKYAGVSFYS